jgi:hypothetical protein
MAVDIAKITKSREAERAKIRGSAASADPVLALELQYIADSLEALRQEYVLGTIGQSSEVKVARDAKP